MPWTAAGGLRAARVLAEGEHMQRRGFLALLGTTVTVPAHEWLTTAPHGEGTPGSTAPPPPRAAAGSAAGPRTCVRSPTSGTATPTTCRWFMDLSRRLT